MTTTADWIRLPVAAIASPRLGGNYRNGTTPTKRPLIKMGNISRISINLSRLEYIPDADPVEEVHLLRFGDVMFNTRNTLDLVGKVSIWRDELPVAYYNSNILRLEFKAEYCGDPQYFGYALNSTESINAIRALATGTTSVAAVYTRDLLKLSLPVPPKEEQRAISSALTSVDRLTATLDRLIAKKQAVKQGMMQQLLTGRARLPGFAQRWRTSSWGALSATIASGATPRRSDPRNWGGSIPWVTSTELKRGKIRRIPQRITEAGCKNANLKIWPRGTFLMAITGLEAAGTRGSCGLLTTKAATNQSCMAVIPGPELLTEYLFYYYLHFGEILAINYTQGTKQMSYTASIVRSLPIHLPSDVAEQAAIAGMLSCMEAEIELLQVRRSKAQNVKTGMMQQLLTGRTRLPVEGVE